VGLTAAVVIALAGAALGALAALLLLGAPGARPRRAGRGVNPPPSEPRVSHPSPPPDGTPGPLETVLDHLRQLLGAERLVLWEADRGADVLNPVASSGMPPRALVAAGDPLTWAAEQRQPLRLDPVPGWAVSGVLAVPVAPGRHPRVLSIEAVDPDPAVAPPLAAVLGDLLGLREQGRRSRADLDRFHRILAFLRELPRSADPGAFPAVLTRTAAEIAGCDGALVARSADPDEPVGVPADGGVVLARYGEGGGPRPGDTFDAGEGALALATRSGATIRREHASEAAGLTGRGETWSGRPRCSASTPLIDPDGRCAGVLALWDDEPIDPEAVELFEALGPLLAIQLRHSYDLARFRDRVERDGLTGLADRAALEDRLELEHRRFHDSRRPVALLILDLDHFKQINDTHGHPAGDEILRGVADLLRANTREPDLAARYGGEEMVVVLPGAMLRQAADVAERIRAAVESTSFEHDGTRVQVTASIGVSSCPESTDDPRTLVPTADAALYAAKHAGRNRVVTAPTLPAGG
jgi:diguanylate cyclase (GGDEF)-like protein